MSILFITGCGKGIGREMITNWLEVNNSPENKVVALYRSNICNFEDLEKYKDRILLIKGDASKKKDLEKCLKQSKDVYERYPDKYLVNAGIRCRNNLENVDHSTLENLWKVNYFSLRELIVCLIKIGIINKNISLVYVSSIVSSVGFINLDDYGATKAASESLIRSTAIKFVKSRFNSIAPGFTKTSYSEDFKHNLPQLYEWTIKRTPMGRWAESKEICNSINFLLTSQSSYITGQKLSVDGGWLANS